MKRADNACRARAWRTRDRVRRAERKQTSYSANSSLTNRRERAKVAPQDWLSIAITTCLT